MTTATPPPLADGGDVLTRPEYRDYVNRLDQKMFVDDLLLHDAALRAEVEILTRGGIIEVMVRNPNVDSWVKENEARMEKAEAEVERLRKHMADEIYKASMDAVNVADERRAAEEGLRHSWVKRANEEKARAEKAERERDAESDKHVALRADLAREKAEVKRLTDRVAQLDDSNRKAAVLLGYGDPPSVEEAVRLDEALAREKERADRNYADWKKAVDEADALAERVRVAREALEEYGQHTPLCRGQEVNSCDCGLTQALGGRGRE